MAKSFLHIIMILLIMQILHSQQDGATSFMIPVRNAIKFNKHVINPTFSFVREQNKHISFTNKRQWVQFENAPTTYLFSYAGRLNENMGFGVGLFQQDYGVLTNFGGILNYAYNVVLDRDSNLTFGANLGVYNSGINEGNIITNTPDPVLQTIESNLLVTLNPGINYGTTFFDFGLSLNNFALYNIRNSKMVEEDPEKSIQAHVMYTGYMSSRGFFDEAKFTGLIRSEFKQDVTVISGIMMLMVPKGIWGQVGYNSLFGASAGMGLHITEQIAIEYNYERGFGDIMDFGPSHEITLAYRFNNKQRYNYSDEDEVTSIFPKARKVKPSITDEATRARIAERVAERRRLAELSEQEKVRMQEEAKAKEAEDRLKAEEKAEALRKQREEEAKLKAEEMAKAEAAAKAKAEAQAKIRAERALQAKQEEDRLKAEQEAQAQRDAEQKAQEAARLAKEQAEKERLTLEQAKANRVAKEKAEAEAERLAQERAEAEAKAREEAEFEADTIQLDAVALSMKKLKEQSDATQKQQDELLDRLKSAVASREQDLKDLKEENDLSEQGIFKAPKPFKSISEENAKLEALQIEFDNVIKLQDTRLEELRGLYDERKRTVSDPDDEIGMIYLNEIQLIVAKQEQLKREKQNLVSELEIIKVATDFERKRRIKRAAFDNEQARFEKDMATLNKLKQDTEITGQTFTAQDFDFGEDQGNNIKILKDVQNVEEGYYMVIAVHSDIKKRDEFLRKAIASGQSNITFFFDVNTSKYYIYYDKYITIDQATNAMQSKGSKPYNSKMSMIKIEN